MADKKSDKTEAEEKDVKDVKAKAEKTADAKKTDEKAAAQETVQETVKAETEAKEDEEAKAESKTKTAEAKDETKDAGKEKEDVKAGKKEAITDLKDLGGAVEIVEKITESRKTEDEKVERVKTVDEYGRAYATGRRKNAIARVWIKPGKGSVVVNGKDQADYFGRKTQRLVLNQPFLISDRVGQFDVYCTVRGGGLSGQAGAIRLGISRALQNFEPDLRTPLKKAGMLTRDARVVERKKINRHKARRSKQWAKR